MKHKPKNANRKVRAEDAAGGLMENTAKIPVWGGALMEGRRWKQQVPLCSLLSSPNPIINASFPDRH